MKRPLLRLGAAIIVAGALLGWDCRAGEAKTSSNTFIVVGTGTISKEDVSAARQQAIENSLVTAVGLVAAELLSVEAMVDNHEKLNAMIYSPTGKYVQDYKVLTEGTFGDHYRVMVQATLSANAVKKQLTKAGVIRAQTVMPKLLFLISEQSVQDSEPLYWWGPGMPYVKPVAESAIAEVLREENFQVIEHGPRVQQMAVTVVSDSPEPGPEEAVNLAKSLNADVVVVGKAVAEAAPNVMGAGIRSFKGLVSATAFRTKTGEQIAAVVRTAISANVDAVAGGRDALRGTGSLVGQQLVADVGSAWQKELLEADKIEIQLGGTGNLANFVMFRRMLTAVEGVEGLTVQELKSDSAVLKVAYRGKARQLADALMLRAFDTFGINIYEVGEDNLKIKLIANAPSARN